MTLSSSEVSVLDGSTVLPVSAPKRTERLKSGTLRLTSELSTGMPFKLKVQSLIGRFEIKNHGTKEHLPDNEKSYLKAIDSDLDFWPTGGIVEVWEETSTPGEYKVTQYKRLK